MGRAIRKKPRAPPRKPGKIDPIANTSDSVEVNGKIKSIFKKPYQGDKFGSSGNDKSGGLAYLSRMNPAADPINIKRDRDADKKKRLEEERLKAELEANKEEGNGAREIFLLEKRRRYGISLATLASKPSKRLEICQDGAVSTLAKLSMSNDRQTLLSVAAAFNSLAASPECRKFLITEGAVQAIIVLCESSMRKIKNDCTRCMCNLSAAVGYEEEIVKNGAIPFLLSNSTSSVQLLEVVLTALLNLSCVPKRYSQIDMVNDAIIHLSGFSMNPSMESILVSAINNLTGLKNNQARLVEEGVVRILSRIAKCAPLETQQLVANSFANLSSCPRSRGKMTDQRVVLTMLEMTQSTDNDEEIKRQCANTVSRLAMDVSCREKIVLQGAIAAIVSMCYAKDGKHNSVESDRVCAAALKTLSLDGDNVEKLIQDSAIPALIALINNNDKFVRQDCARCLCIMFEYEAGIDRMIDQGAVEALVKLADPTDIIISADCALALCNLLSHKEAERVVEKGILEALVRLSKSKCETTRITCAAALWELTDLSTTDPKKIIPALIQMLRDEGGSKIKGDCAAALYNLAQNMTNCALMMKEDCIEPLLSLIAEGQAFDTRIQACAILSRLSFQDEFCKELATKNLLKAMFKLAELEIPASEVNKNKAQVRVLKTQQRIANAIYNMSRIKENRLLLLEVDTPSFLSNFSSRPSEAIRQACAAALCNLSSDPGTEFEIAESGAIRSLLINALVASDRIETKKICMKTLYNLLYDEAVHDTMVQEGILWSFAAICKSEDGGGGVTDDSEMTRMCSTAFCNLTCNYSSELMTSMASIKSLFWQTTSQDPITRLNSAQAVLNILTKVNEDTVEIAQLSVRYMKSLCVTEPTNRIAVIGILAFCILSQFESCRAEIKNLDALNKLNFEIAKIDSELSYAYAATICNISQDKDALSSVVDDYILTALIQLCMSNEERTIVAVSKTLYNLSTVKKNIKRLCDFGIVEAMQELLVSDFFKTNSEVQISISAAMYNFSCLKDCQLSLVSKDAVSLLYRVWDSTDDFVVRRYCCLSVCHLSCGYVNSAKIVGQKGTSMICWLSLTNELTEIDGSWCVASLRNLLSTNANHKQMLAEGVVDSLVLLSSRQEEFIAFNSAAALRAMTYNKATRSALIQKNAINVIIAEGGEDNIVAEEDDLKMNKGLLQAIEAESWANGSRGIQREGRAAELPEPSLLTEAMGRGDETLPALIEMEEIPTNWWKVTEESTMVEPSLESTPKQNNQEVQLKGKKGSRLGVGSVNNIKEDDAKEGGNTTTVDNRGNSKLIPKRNIETVWHHKPLTNPKGKEEDREHRAELFSRTRQMSDLDIVGNINGEDFQILDLKGVHSDGDENLDGPERDDDYGSLKSVTLPPIQQGEGEGKVTTTGKAATIGGTLRSSSARRKKKPKPATSPKKLHKAFAQSLKDQLTVFD